MERWYVTAILTSDKNIGFCMKIEAVDNYDAIYEICDFIDHDGIEERYRCYMFDITCNQEVEK